MYKSVRWHWYTVHYKQFRIIFERIDIGGIRLNLTYSRSLIWTMISQVSSFRRYQVVALNTFQANREVAKFPFHWKIIKFTKSVEPRSNILGNLDPSASISTPDREKSSILQRSRRTRLKVWYSLNFARRVITTAFIVQKGLGPLSDAFSIANA